VYELLYRTLIARVDAERAHHLALDALALAAQTPGGLAALSRFAPPPDDRLRLRVWDLPFANPLGVAAGLDKDAGAVEALIALGFGHVEVGTVTLRQQPGNPKPRLWRAVEQGAVVNAMGFPSNGSAVVRQRLVPLRPQGVIGINIGKNRDTPLDAAAEDYAGLVSALFEVANYITVNVSSPNTPGLRSLQMADELERIMAAVSEANQRAAEFSGRNPKPLLVKIAPDLSETEIESVAGAVLSSGASGIIATNTTTSRDALPDRYRDLPGGMSGAPLRERANHVTKVLYRTLGTRIPIVGVGGISSGADAIERIRAGATLVQAYTGFTFAGPAFAGTILREMIEIADREGWKSITEIVGLDASTE
jgi:dihydroorotate dehydrogenase